MDKNSRILFVFSFLLYTSLIIYLFIRETEEEKEFIFLLAKQEAITNYSKDIQYRRWATLHGGVYVPIDLTTPPNPYLANTPERDIQTPSGKKLTLMNPAYMTRQVHELSGLEYGVKGHITSLNLIRPENKPDNWEKKVLQKFDLGIREYYELSPIHNKQYFRYMRALYVEKGCIRCHANQGYKVGEVRGGISISLPWDSKEKLLISKNNNHLIFYSLIYFISMAIFLAIYLYMNKVTNDRKKKDKLLSESENNYRRLFEANKDGILIVYLDEELKLTDIQDLNNAAAEMIGYTKEEMLERTANELEINLSAEKIRQRKEEILQNGYTTFEIPLRHKNGDIIYAEVKASLIKYNNRAAILNIVHDITERKKNEFALIESETKYRELFNRMNDTVWIIDFNGEIIDVNETAVKNSGYSKEEITTLGLSVIDSSLTKDQIKELAKNMPVDKVQIFETTHKTKDGKIINVEVSSSLVKYNGAMAIMSIARDISDKKRNDDIILQSEKDYKTIFQNAHDAIIIFDPEDETILEVNDRACQIYGYPKEELIGTSLINYSKYPDIGTQKVLELLEQKTINNFETVQIRKDGSEIYYEVNASLIEYKGKKAILSLNHDVSFRKLAETALKKAAEQFRLISSTSMDGFWIVDTTGRILQVNQAYCDLIGYSEEELLSMTINDLDIKESVDETENHMRELVKDGYKKFETKHKCKDGSELDFEISVTYSENLQIIMVFLNNITERKKIDAALREKEIIFDSFLKNSPVYIFFKDADIRAIRLSDNFEKMLGKPINELVGKTMNELFPSELSKSMIEDDKKILNEGKQFTVVETFNDKVYETTKYPIDIDGKRKLLAGFTLDITERWKAEQELRKSKTEFQNLYNMFRLMSDTMPDMLWAKDLDCRFIFTNKSICENLLGASSTDEPIGKNDLFFAKRERNSNPDHPSWHTFGEMCMDSDAVTLKELKPMQFYEYGNIKGKFNYLDVHKAPLYDDDGRLIGIVGTARDITEKWHADQKLRESEAKFRSYVENIQMGIIVANREGKHVESNPYIEKMLGYSHDEILQTHITDLIHESMLNEASVHFTKVISEGYAEGEFRLKKKNGEIIWGIVTASQISNEYFLAIFQDITERKSFQLALTESEEKFRTLFQNLSEGVSLNEMIFNEAGEMIDYKILEVNPAFYIHSAKKNNAVGHYATELYGLSSDYIKSFWLKHKESNEITILELNSPSGNDWYFVTASPFLNNRFITSFLNITEKKKDEAELLKQIEEINRFNKLMIGREQKMIELKNEINELIQKLGMPAKYSTIENN